MSEALHSSRLYKKQCTGFFATAFIITLLQIFVNFFAFSSALFSDNYTDQPALAVIDNLLHCILQLHLTFFTDLSNLGTDAVFYQLFDGFSENIPSSVFFSFSLMNVIRSCACSSLPTIGAISVSIFALIIWMDGLTDLILTPYLFP